MIATSPASDYSRSSREVAIRRTMGKQFSGILSMGVAAVAALCLSCGGGGSGGGSDGDGSNIGGPSGTESFAGSTVSFNPSLTFLAGGVLEYVNEAVGGQFPEAPATPPETGTYSYAPAADHLSGTLTLNLPTLDGGYTAEIALSDFITANGIVQSFTGTFFNEGSFEFTVVSGSIMAEGRPPQTGGDGEFVFQSNGNIAVGTTFTRAHINTVYGGFYGGGSATYSPLILRNPGDIVSFGIGTNGDFRFEAKTTYWSNLTRIYSVPYIGESNGVLTYRGPDNIAGVDGRFTIGVDTTGTQSVSIFWEDLDFSDTERQIFGPE